MKKLIVVAMLFAASAALAAPVSVSFERNAYGWNVGPGYDNYPCGDSPWSALSFSNQSYSGCNETSFETTLGFSYGSYPDGSPIPLGIGSVGWEYDSITKSNSKSFSLDASSNVHGSAENIFVWVNHLYYWVEFVVTEEVLYTGSLALTDGQLQNSGCWPGDAYGQHCFDEQLKYAFSGTTYSQGSILGPGTYQYWKLGGRSFDAGDNAIWISSAIDGPIVSATNQEDYSFAFTTVVPIPAAVWLFGSGLGLLGWLRRRQS